MQDKKQNISPIKQRILYFASTLGISKREFYNNIGVSRGTLESKTGITEDVITKFFATYPRVNIEWLITGRGSMLSSDDSDNAVRQTPEPVAKRVNGGEDQGIPLLPLDAMAGAFTDDISVMAYECERYIVPAFKGADFLIPVKGDSMLPTYKSGDLVACQRVPLDDMFFQWNKTYVLDTVQGALIKRIRRGSDSEHVLIVSDNPAYEPFELSLKQFHGVALVRGIIRIE